MTMFTETQAFVQFVQDRIDRSPGDPEIMFFDEVIKAKVNRSRFRLGKEETKFLDDSSYGIQSTIRAAAPSGEAREYGKCSNTLLFFAVEWVSKYLFRLNYSLLT